ncbi:prepilin-type N-terminal cleavage/methylation domain-containing protein [Candidatus Dojkabacteria bacterium]|nr:prepilin-type N-terminal cleavage/methylation domain-containing protein [Candidatus Dojkabacteria bacterium]
MTQEYKNKTRSQRIAKRLGLRAFTLLELLLVIAIISVLAGLVIFNLRPADVLKDANDVKNVANSNDLRKAIETYTIDHGGDASGLFSGISSDGYYEICKQGVSDVSCINLTTLVTEGKISNIPVDTTKASTLTTGYKIHYEQGRVDVVTGSEYDAYIASGATLTQGLIGWWKMDEAAANTCTGGVNDSCDSSGNTNNGAWAGNTAIGGGKYGNGIVLDGTDDYVDMNDVFDFNYTDARTFSAWIYPTSLSGNPKYIMSKQSTTHPVYDGWQFYVRDSVWGFQYIKDWNTQNMIYLESYSPNIVLNKWQHVVIAYTNKTANFYLDGIKVPVTSVWGNITSNVDNALSFNIGALNDSAGTSEFPGKLDELRLYNRALSDIEAQALYNYAPGPIAHWKFDETSGTTVSDSSGNNNGGSWLGSSVTRFIQGKYGNAGFFGGNTTNDRISVTNNNGLDFTSNTLSMSLWVKRSETSRTQSIGLYSNRLVGPPYSGYGVYIDNHNVLFMFGAGSGAPYIRSNATIVDTNWHHIGVVRDGGTAKIYIDGVLDKTDGALSTGNITYDAFWTNRHIGSPVPQNDGYYHMEGLIDDLRVYNYARTPQQILQDMNNL